MSEEINTNCDDAKVVLIGEAGVGKTCIIKQFVHHTFDENEVSSISSQFSTRIINVPETPKAIRFDLWDTAGQEKYRSVAKIFYKDARIVIFVYDILNYKSFEEFSSAIADYIDYYNNERIQAKTKWMPPVKYRMASIC